MARASILLLLALVVCFGCAQAADRTLAFALHQRNLPLLERIFWERTDLSHPDYAKWMTLEEIAAITGASDETLEVIKYEIGLLGGIDVRVAPSREYVIAEFPNRVANSILMSFGHPHASRTAVSNNNRLGLAMPILSYGLTFRKHVAYVMESTHSSESELGVAMMSDRNAKRFKPETDAMRANSMFADPASQKKSYSMPTELKSTFANNSQAVWGPGTFGVSNSDLLAFYGYWGIPASVTSVKVPGYVGVPGGDNFGEGTLDTTYITSMALGVKTFVINTNNTMPTEEGPGFGYALENFMLLTMAQEPSVPYVLSMSLGSLSWDSCNQMCLLGSSQSQGAFSFADCMQYVQYTQRQVCMMDTAPQTERISTEFMKLGLRGVTLLAATGDGGSHYSFQPFPSDSIGYVLNQVSCQYNFPTFPSASPYVLGVGGTQWGGAPSPSQPIAWSASGSGFSWRFPRPAYQEAAVSSYLKQYANSPGFPGFKYFNSTNRAYPDVAAIADNVPMWLQGLPTVTGGTSASAPTMAGIISMINDARLSAGKASLGFVNPALYQLAQQHPGALFYDVTQGNSACASDGSCCNTGFPATTGWDPVTGLGSPIWTGLIQFLG